jgi:arginyl-tRNA synthetase
MQAGRRADFWPEGAPLIVGRNVRHPRQRPLRGPQIGEALAELRDLLEQTARSLVPDLEDGSGRLTLERPAQPEHGDYSSNAAMVLAGRLGQPPREVAEQLRAGLAERLGDDAERLEVAGPGFINVVLSDRWYRQALASLAGADAAAVEQTGPAQRVVVEFVSANPTGPLTAAGGRHAAHGDSIARMLLACGNQVDREYYVNDRGGQIERFAQSIAARMTASELPEDGYEGEYVAELGRELAEAGVSPDDLEGIARAGVERMLERIGATLERYGVEFDTWFSERSLHDGSELAETLEALRASGHVYESEGAVWLRTTDLGDDKDRVLVRSSGEPTYFASDIAYHRDKLRRGYELMIVLLGADHHGYTARMEAAVAALGAPGAYEGQIIQLVNIVEGGERAQMSKRRGEFVTLDELLDDIGVDATRWFMLQRSHDTTVDLDLELARRESNENPVYYVQYAHARIASILRKAGAEADETPGGFDLAAVAAPVEPAERELLKRLLELSAEIREAADRRAPHRLCAYTTAVAADFHAFYRDCQVLGAEGEGVEASRLALCVSVKRTIAETLGLLGIAAPERM